MKLVKILVLTTAILGNGGPRLEATTFTDLNGRQIEASVLRIVGNKVELQMSETGKAFLYPIAKLSKKDRKFLKLWAEVTEEQEKLGNGKNKTEEPANTKEVEEPETPIRIKPPAGSPAKSATKEMQKKYGLTDNYDAEWPSLISIGLDVEIGEPQEGLEEGKFVYQSPNYEFVCDVRLSKGLVKKFALMFEATREYCRLLPISTMKAHVPGEKKRLKVLLFETKESYIQNGGPPSSAGVFITRGGDGVVMAPLTSLGVKKVGSGFMFDYKGSNKTLPHELTHQLTDSEYFNSGARGWFSEGLAEYVAVTPYRSGKFMVRSNLADIKEYVTEYGDRGRGGRNLGTKINAPNLKDYCLQPYSSFTGNGNFNYGLGLLLTYYFFHMDEDRTRLNSFLQALKNGKEADEALEVLLAGRTYEELESQISKAWRSRGIRITFGSS